MPDAAPFRRKWRVTFLRGAAALGLSALSATGFALWVSGSPEAGSPVISGLFVLGIIIAVPTLWLLPAGMLVDHYLSRLGFTLVTILHVIGGVVAFFVALLGLTIWAIITNQGLGGPLAFIFVVLVPPWMILGSLVAWAIPGSFPKGRGAVLDSARWVRKRLTT